MKFLLFLIILLTSQSFSLASENEDELLAKKSIQWISDNLKTVNKSPVENEPTCNKENEINIMEGLKLDATCDQFSTKLNGYNLSVMKEIKNQKNSLTNAINLNKYKGQTLDSLKEALNTLICMENVFPKIEMFCWRSGQCKVNALAYVEANFFGVRQKQINICSPLWEYMDKVKIGVLVHELSHICGTSDAAYFDSSPTGSGSPRDNKRTPFSKIADTYNYWFQFGFCIPGDTCK